MTSVVTEASGAPSNTFTSVRVLITEVARLCALANIPESFVVPIFSEAYASAPRASQDFQSDCADPVFASQVLTHWHESDNFLDEDGAPKKLSISANEFEDLCAAAGDRGRASSALALLLASDAICQRGDVVSTVRRDVIVGQSLRSGVDLAIRLCGEFARTLNHNHTRSHDEPRRFERTAVSTRFPSRHVPALLAYLSLHAESFLEDLDNWLKARDTDAETTTVGVGVHLFLSQ